MHWVLSCVVCYRQYNYKEVRFLCDCGGILELKRLDLNKIKTQDFDKKPGGQNILNASGVWRFRELLPPIAGKNIISKPEGNTNLYTVGVETSTGLNKIGEYAGGIKKFYLKHEGENPTGSFKDRGMTVAISQAKDLGMKAVACASTGNTSASVASYASLAGLKCLVFIPEGKIALGKLSQAISYGATTIQIKGDFDQAMNLVQSISKSHGIYLVNSINPFRIEGQKTILFEALQQFSWKVPDWIVLPAGNLGNTSAIGKALFELKEIGIIKKLPKVAAIQAKGANPFFQSFKSGFKRKYEVKAETVASAIRIGNPVSFERAKKVILETKGVVEEVSDNEILDAKAIIDSSGIGCEPASAATLAGIKKLVEKKVIKKQETVLGILTGHLLKDSATTLSYHEQKITGVKPKYPNKIIKLGSNKKSINKLLSLYV